MARPRSPRRPPRRPAARPDRTPPRYNVASVAERSALNAELAARLAAFDCHLPCDGTSAGRGLAAGVFDDAREILALAERVNAGLGVRRGPAPRVQWDYTFPTYDEYEHEVDRIFEELSEYPLGELDFFKGGPLFFYDAGGGVLLCNTTADSTTEFGLSRALSKIFAALGIGEIYSAILELLEQGWKELMEELGRNIVTKQWRAVKEVIKKILRIVISEPFRKKLIEKVGVSAASKVLGQVAAKFVPGLGWVLIIGSIVWALAENFI
jgi:hypothetical protein